MKKSELKASLELAKTTLELAMDALKQAHNELNASKFPQGGYAPKTAPLPNPRPFYGMPDKLKLKLNFRVISGNKLEVEGIDYNVFTDKPNPQAGDYIVTGKVTPDNLSKLERVKDEAQNEHPKYECIKDYGEAKVGEVYEYGYLPQIDNHCYARRANESTVVFLYIGDVELNPSHFQLVNPKKATPLTDLANEVEIEKEANELIEHFMPLVNGWRANDLCGLNDAIIGKTVWSFNKATQRKAAIKIAIKHCELYLNPDSVISSFHFGRLKSQLEKML